MTEFATCRLMKRYQQPVESYHELCRIGDNPDSSRQRSIGVSATDPAPGPLSFDQPACIWHLPGTQRRPLAPCMAVTVGIEGMMATTRIVCRDEALEYFSQFKTSRSPPNHPVHARPCNYLAAELISATAQAHGSATQPYSPILPLNVLITRKTGGLSEEQYTTRMASS